MNPRYELWDFDENKNYITIFGLKVLKYPDAVKAAILLQKINDMILRCLESIIENEMITQEVDLLINTPFTLQEMQIPSDQLIIKFEGLNKPKNIYVTNERAIGPDKNLRAKYRIIFLTIRKNGKLKNINSLKSLVAHELTHTALNHVQWRDDDHGPEFKMMYEIILRNLN